MNICKCNKYSSKYCIDNVCKTCCQNNKCLYHFKNDFRIVTKCKCNNISSKFCIDNKCKLCCANNECKYHYFSYCEHKNDKENKINYENICCVCDTCHKIFCYDYKNYDDYSTNYIATRNFNDIRCSQTNYYCINGNCFNKISDGQYCNNCVISDSEIDSVSDSEIDSI